MLLPSNLVICAKPNLADKGATFVGLKTDADGRVEFHLPYGIDAEGMTREAATRLFYKIFVCVEECTKLDSLKTLDDSHYDTGKSELGSMEVGFYDQTPNQSFSRMRYLRKMMELIELVRDWDISTHNRLSELQESKSVRNIPPDVLFLDDNSFIIEREIQSQRMVIFGAPALCYLLSYLFADLAEFCEWSQSQIVSMYARRFKEEFLFMESVTLFDPQSAESNRLILLEILELIHKNTHYRDTHYWDLYEVCESYLTARIDSSKPGSVYWGVKSFARVWELLCVDWFIRYRSRDLLYIDAATRQKSPGDDVSAGIGLWNKRTETEYPFKVTIDGTDTVKTLKPDVVIQNQNQSITSYNAPDIIFGEMIDTQVVPSKMGISSYTLTLNERFRSSHGILREINSYFKKKHAKPKLAGYKLSVITNERLYNGMLKYIYARIKEQNRRSCEIFDIKYWPLDETDIYANSNSHEHDAIGKQITYHLLANQSNLFDSVESTFILPASPSILPEDKRSEEHIGIYLNDDVRSNRFAKHGIRLFAAVTERVIDNFCLSKLG